MRARRVDVRRSRLQAQGHEMALPPGECHSASTWVKADRLHPLIPRETERSHKLYRSRGAVEREFGRLKHEWALLPLRVRGAGSGPVACRPDDPREAHHATRERARGAARRVGAPSAHLLDKRASNIRSQREQYARRLMAKFRQAVWWRLAYGPRFLRHYWHRRQSGYSIAHAFGSSRRRMRERHL